MMHPSAFDEALCCPFIDEKPQKRWSMNSIVSTNSPNAVSISSLFGGDYDDNDLELGHLMNDSPRRQRQEGPIILNLETIVFDDALVRERHDEIISINQSMHQIHAISKGEKNWHCHCVVWIWWLVEESSVWKILRRSKRSMRYSVVEYKVLVLETYY
jgi:hypothetical protein